MATTIPNRVDDIVGDNVLLEGRVHDITISVETNVWLREVNNVETDGFQPSTPSRFGTHRCPGTAIFGAATLNCCGVSVDEREER